MFTLPRFLERMHYKRISALEREIGYRLTFPNIHEGWIQSWACFNLSKSWKKFGLDITGIDYFTMGEFVNGISTRFDPCAQQFQSWIGGYLVRLDTRRTVALQDCVNLAVVDQLNWLRHYGDPHPRCDLRASGFARHGLVSVSGFKGELYIGGGFSHADVGKANSSPRTRLATSIMAMAFNMNSQSLRSTGRNFVPTVAQPSYSEIYLKGYIIDIEIDASVRVVLYGNGAIYRDEQGRERDTFETIKRPLLNTLKQTVITRT
jgi:hypothetical protein